MAVRVIGSSDGRMREAAYIHERGYRAYQERGLTARRPYYNQVWQAEAWDKGYAKAKRELA